MQGPNDFCVTGNLKSWDRWKDLNKIKIPTLLMGAAHDVIDLNDIYTMGKLINNSKIFISQNGSHITFYDDQQKYFQVIINFLKTKHFNLE
jgi:proline iminopeptidase